MYVSRRIEAHIQADSRLEKVASGIFPAIHGNVNGNSSKSPDPILLFRSTIFRDTWNVSRVIKLPVKVGMEYYRVLYLYRNAMYHLSF